MLSDYFRHNVRRQSDVRESEADRRYNRELFARLYKTPVAKVLFTEYDAAYAFKGTIPRRVSSGDIGDTDVYGAQQHAPILEVEVPI